MGKQAFDQKIEALEPLRLDPASSATLDHLRKTLKDRNNFLVSKAAALVGEFGLTALIPDLENVFERFMTNPVKTDPQCWAKNAIVKALKNLGYQESALLLRGIVHIQLEPVWGGQEDTAATLRGACGLALVTCPLPRLQILENLADRLACDPVKTVRVDAARAIAQLSGPDSLLLLRFKALAGDPDPEVTGQCLVCLLDISATEYIPFVADLVDTAIDPDVRLEAVAALGECHDHRATQILQDRWKTYNDPEIRRAILLSLGASRQPSAAVFLCSLIADGRVEDASNAIRSLSNGRFRDEYRDLVAGALVHRGEARLMEIFEKEFLR